MVQKFDTKKKKVKVSILKLLIYVPTSLHPQAYNIQNLIIYQITNRELV